MARRAITQSATTLRLRQERRRRITVVALLVISVVLLILSTVQHPVINRARAIMSDAASPVLAVLSIPVEAYYDLEHWVSDVFALREENARLRAENAELRDLQARAALLSRENSDLRTLLAVQSPQVQLAATAKVIGTSGGAFVRSVLLSAGRHDGVRDGMTASTPAGLVGRVIETGRGSARVLLLTDLNSRIPVRVGEAGATAILVGRNSGGPEIEFLPPDEVVQVGEQIITSGHGGLFPADIPVGRVVSVSETGIVVDPFASLDRLEFVHLYGLNVAPEETGEEEQSTDPASEPESDAASEPASEPAVDSSPEVEL